MNAAETIEHLPLDALIPYARNSRTHSDAQVAQIAASMREFGFTNPVLVDASGGIIAGHGRVLAARQLGLATVPCIRLGYLTEAQRRAYVIADNKLALNAGWDEQMLMRELADLDALGADLSLTFLDDSEIDALLAIEVAPAELPAAPEVVQNAVAEMERIKAQRRVWNENVASKSDTEHYLVIVFDTREQREQTLAKLGMPHDERYLHHRAVQIERKLGSEKFTVASDRPLDAASSKHSGATG